MIKTSNKGVKGFWINRNSILSDSIDDVHVYVDGSNLVIGENRAKSEVEVAEINRERANLIRRLKRKGTGPLMMEVELRVFDIEHYNSLPKTALVIDLKTGEVHVQERVAGCAQMCEINTSAVGAALQTFIETVKNARVQPESEPKRAAKPERKPAAKLPASLKDRSKAKSK